MVQTFKGDVYGGQFASVINNYYNYRDYWVSYTDDELRTVIKNIKQRKRQANWHKWTYPPTLLGLFLSICAVLVLGGNLYLFLGDYSRVINSDNTYSYIAATLAIASICCLYISQNKLRRTQIFINRCNQLIDLCEQLIFERQYE